ncbi:hypothetical protein, partial [Moorena sp. SIO4E2]|uniref:hypothetical protein n=1 Tax=Moorena sp. SIO4E2 TaxID=2607826 RepID=UPI00257AFC6C
KGTVGSISSLVATMSMVSFGRLLAMKRRPSKHAQEYGMRFDIGVALLERRLVRFREVSEE